MTVHATAATLLEPPLELQTPRAPPGAASGNEDEVQEVEHSAAACEAGHQQTRDEAAAAREQVAHVELGQVEGDARQAQDDGPGRKRIKVVRVRAGQQDQRQHVQKGAYAFVRAIARASSLRRRLSYGVPSLPSLPSMQVI